MATCTASYSLPVQWKLYHHRCDSFKSNGTVTLYSPPSVCCLSQAVPFLCVFVVLCVHCCSFLTLDAALLARSQYSEGPATGHLDTGFFQFPCAYKQILRWFPRFQVATTCFSCSRPNLNLVVSNFMFCLHVE